MFDEGTLSFITGHHIKNYKNYFFVTHRRVLKIITARNRNGRLDFHLITELTLPFRIKNIRISNLNHILVSTHHLASDNRFYKLNMELIAKTVEFPILHGRRQQSISTRRPSSPPCSTTTASHTKCAF